MKNFDFANSKNKKCFNILFILFQLTFILFWVTFFVVLN